jgi:subtilisin family serine protease
MKTAVLIILLSLACACVKDESSIGRAAGSTGTVSGGASGGSGGNQITYPDPLASQAWHLKNTGTQNAFSLATGSNGEDINVEPVHTLFNIRGRNIRIAVSDTGTDIEHADLAANALSGEHRNYTSSQSHYWHNANPYPSGDESHGTGVTGLIAALGWNGIGSRGVAPAAKFASFRYVFDPLPSETNSSRLAKQLDQLYGNFDIFNYSYGKAGYLFVEEDQVVRDALKLGIKNLRNGKGALYVQSAGNSFYEKFAICDDETDPLCFDEALGNTNAHESLATPYKIVVGATNALGKVTSYSTPGSGLWVSAPGGEDGFLLPAMVTTDLSGCTAGMSYRNPAYADFFDFGFHNLNSNCDYTNRFNGTSSAAPVVSGVVALMLEANPKLTWRDVKHILAETSDVIDLRCPVYDLYCSLNELTHPLNKDVANYLYDYIWTRILPVITIQIIMGLEESMLKPLFRGHSPTIYRLLVHTKKLLMNQATS